MAIPAAAAVDAVVAAGFVLFVHLPTAGGGCLAGKGVVHLPAGAARVQGTEAGCHAAVAALGGALLFSAIGAVLAAVASSLAAAGPDVPPPVALYDAALAACAADFPAAAAAAIDLPVAAVASVPVAPAATGHSSAAAGAAAPAAVPCALLAGVLAAVLAAVPAAPQSVPAQAPPAVLPVAYFVVPAAEIAE